MILTPSENFDERMAPVEMLVLHYTGMKTFQEALNRMRDSGAKVSAHYVVDETGETYRLVDEEKRAWHAGVSSWRKKTDINSRSIGIEIVNPGHEFGYRPFPDIQIKAVIELCNGIINRYRISPENIVGHSDIAPTRKKDPGELFPWETLSENGIGLWTNDFEQPSLSCKEMLTAIGYDITDENAALTAFQRRFYPQSLQNDIGKTKERLAAIFHLYKGY